MSSVFLLDFQNLGKRDWMLSSFRLSTNSKSVDCVWCAMGPISRIWKLSRIFFWIYTRVIFPLSSSSYHPRSRLFSLQQGIFWQPQHYSALCCCCKLPHMKIITSVDTLQGTLFNFLVIGGLLIAVDTLGFMGDLPAIPIEDHHVRKMPTSYFPKDLCSGQHNSLQHQHDPGPSGDIHLLQHRLCCGPRGGPGHVRDKHGSSVL